MKFNLRFEVSFVNFTKKMFAGCLLLIAQKLNKKCFEIHEFVAANMILISQIILQNIVY